MKSIQVAVLLLSVSTAFSSPLRTVVDLNLYEPRKVVLRTGQEVNLEVLELREARDSLRGAIRSARVKLRVNGNLLEVESGNYNLPVVTGDFRVDCPVTRGFYEKTNEDRWGLNGKDVRLRLWSAEGPLIDPETFQYPLRQRWLASDSQMTNEPVFVDGPEPTIGARDGQVYYHSGLDFDGVESKEEILSASAGRVIAAGGRALSEPEDFPVEPRDDYIFVLDERGWFYWYGHLSSIEVTAGQMVEIGQRIGLMGKEGWSGGCSHLHFEIKCRQPSGMWGTEDAYAYAWEAYVRQFDPKILAIARPHQLALTGQKVTLDGGRSRSFVGGKLEYEWTLSDGRVVAGPKAERTYESPGTYSEVLRVSDDEGNQDYDFTVVQIFGDGRHPPTINANYYPTFGINPGDPVTFGVRTFAVRGGKEIWDFGDGSAQVQVLSDGNVEPHSKDGYALTQHAYKEAGVYLVRVERRDSSGIGAVAHLDVVVEAGKPHERNSSSKRRAD